jgi:perosamine synthetase
MHGCSTTDRFWCTEIGLKYRMANVQAAVALGQFERVHSMVEAKREIFEWYREDLAGHPGISFHDQADWAFATHAVSSIMVDPGQGVDRDTVRGLLKERKIDTRQAFPPISQYPMWKTHEARPVAAEIGAKAINLPSGVRLTRAQVRYITQALWQITA